MNAFLDEIWINLHQEETRLLQWKKCRKIRENVMGIYFFLGAWLTTFLSYFCHTSYFVEGVEFPLKELLASFGNGTDNAILVLFGCTAAVVLLGVILAFILRKATGNVKVKANARSWEPEHKSLESALQWANKLNDLWYKKNPRFVLYLLLAAVGIAAMAVVSTMMCQRSSASTEDIQNNILIGAMILVFFVPIWAIFLGFIHTSRPDSVTAPFYEKKIREQMKVEAEAKKRRRIIEDGTKSFLDGDYGTVRSIFAGFDAGDCGDVVAIRALCQENVGETVEALRTLYSQLWNAKELGFYNEKIRLVTQQALDTVTPIVMEEAQADMLEIYSYCLKGRYSAAVYRCEKHAAYGHPDALAIQIFAKLLSETYNQPKYYEDFLRQLKLAKRRGVDIFDEDMIEEWIVELEVKIRQNQYWEEERKRRERERPFVPSVYMSGPLASWAEDSGWTDVRTGETLYRVDGRIVNGNGEEVSPAWWED